MKARALALAATLCASSAVAITNSCPRDAFLEVTGKVRANASDGSFKFTEESFLALPATSLTTSTAWTPRSEFRGPTLETVLAAAGVPAGASDLRFFAIDAYEISIPITDIPKYRPILAYLQNGARLEIATRGPVFLVYPRDQYPEMTTIKGQAQYVWMVCKIHVS